jgi:hypothetical protein
VIQAPKSVRTLIAFAKLARILGILGKGFEMAVKNIEAREEFTAFAAVWLVLYNSCMVK